MVQRTNVCLLNETGTISNDIEVKEIEISMIYEPAEAEKQLTDIIV